jgi:hypothetical protein
MVGQNALELRDKIVVTHPLSDFSINDPIGNRTRYMRTWRRSEFIAKDNDYWPK